jgi:hypothetical protein
VTEKGGYDRHSNPEALPFTRLPGFLDVVYASRCPTRRLGEMQDVLRIGPATMPQAQPSAASVSADPSDLVTRALAILAEESEKWKARRGANPAPLSTR